MRSSTSTARALLQGVGPLACSLRRGLATDASPAASSTRAALEYCARLVREHDRDNFTWVVQLPKDLRARVIALRAFNLEALMISEQVSSKELPLVQIRFQWWRDALAPALEGKPAGHPVLMALAAVHAQAPLSRYQLRRLLDAREEDALSTQPPLTVQQLEQYAEGTASQLQYVQLAAAGIADREADHCASHVGKAVGISAVLRGTPFHASRRRSYLPLEVCAKHRVSQEELFRGEPSEAVRDVALEVASVARAHLEEARSFCSKLPKGASSVLQSATGAALYLQALERRNFDLFDSELVKTGGASPLWYALRLKYNLLRGVFCAGRHCRGL